MHESTTPPEGADRPLPAARAFVVQLGDQAEIAHGRWVGRIVHVVSSQSVHFETLAELVGFMERVLARDDDAPDPRREP